VFDWGFLLEDVELRTITLFSGSLGFGLELV
jgi:hypothetical protein